MPSGYTTTIGPLTHARRQLAFVRNTDGSLPTRSSSFSRLFKNAHDSRPASFAQHFGSLWSAQRKMWRLNFSSPSAAETFCNCSSATATGLASVHAPRCCGSAPGCRDPVIECDRGRARGRGVSACGRACPGCPRRAAPPRRCAVL